MNKKKFSLKFIFLITMTIIFLIFSLIFVIKSIYSYQEENKNKIELTMNKKDVTIEGNSFLKVNQTIDLNFDLIKTDKETKTIETMKKENLSNIKGWKIIETVPSLDTPVCSMQTAELNMLAPKYEEVNFIIISQDLPFAQSRYCGANGVENVSIFSDYQNREFSKTNHLLIKETQLNSRTIMVINPKGKIVYIEYANEQTESLNLQKALNSLPSDLSKN